MRAAMQAVFDAESVPVRPAPLTDTFVQTVPDKCDRIVWRYNYYHLPIAQPAPLQQGEYLPLPEPAIKACHCYSTNQVREAIDADRAARGAALRLLTQKEKDSLGRCAEGMDGNEWDQWVQEKFAQVNGLRIQGGSYGWY